MKTWPLSLGKILFSTALTYFACSSFGQVPGEAPRSGNPIIPGYYADPAIVSYQGTHYVYATIDPWGGEQLSCWTSSDFRNWEFHLLNWPTKTECTSPTSMGAMVWAPSVIQGNDGRFYMHVSVGSEVWVGVADHPLGPWENPLGDQPMISADFARKYHMIDAQAFIDDDGQAYLYWGSGWNWTNGHCFAARLNPDMSSFAGDVVDVTPANYFEAPVMVKHDGRYYLMYSNGKTTIDTYQVHYAVGESPLGPFTEASNSPILVTNHAENVLSPGHHTVFENEGQHYILYHRHNIPFEPVHRQICVDDLAFAANGLIEKVTPTHQGPTSLKLTQYEEIDSTLKVKASSSSHEHTKPEKAFDLNYATRWQAAASDESPSLQIEFTEIRTFTSQTLIPQFGWKLQRFIIESSLDGEDWATLRDYRNEGISGSPILIEETLSCRYLRIRFLATDEANPPALFEWKVR